MERASWESSLKELADAVLELRGDRLVLARLKAAYETGFAAVHNSQAVEKQDAADLDQPIPDNFFQQLDQEWKRSYNLPIEAHLDPCDSLRGRIWRELRRRTLTLLELRKVRSVIGGSAPLEEETISLDGGVTLQFAKEGYAAPKNVIEYYLRLRTLCMAWAWCGNFRQKCLDGKDKLVMPLHVSLDYADMALHHCSSYGSSSLAWLQRNDLLTRGSMCAKVRRGMTAAVALQEALHETHLAWRSPGPRAVEASVGTLGGPKSGGKRLQEDTTPPPPPAKVPRARLFPWQRGAGNCVRPGMMAEAARITVVMPFMLVMYVFRVEQRALASPIPDRVTPRLEAGTLLLRPWERALSDVIRSFQLRCHMLRRSARRGRYPILRLSRLSCKLGMTGLQNHAASC